MTIQSLIERGLKPRTIGSTGRGGLPTFTDVSAEGWPKSYIPISSNTATELMRAVVTVQKFGAFTLTLSATISNGTEYNVEWGDGSSSTHTSGVEAVHVYNYDTLSFAHAVSLSPTNNTVEYTGHSYVDNDFVEVYELSSSLNDVVEGEPYYVINSTSDNFQLSETVDGTAIPIESLITGYLTNLKQVEVLVTPEVGGNFVSGYFEPWSTLQADAGMVRYDYIGAASTSMSSFQNPVGYSSSREIGSPHLVKAAIDVPVADSYEALFQGCMSLSDISGILTGAKNMYRMFLGCRGISTWPVFSFAPAERLEEFMTYNSGAGDETISSPPCITGNLTLNLPSCDIMEEMLRGAFFDEIYIYNMPNVYNMIDAFIGSRLSKGAFNSTGALYLGTTFSSCLVRDANDINYSSNSVTGITGIFSDNKMLTKGKAVSCKYSPGIFSGAGSIFSGCSKLRGLYSVTRWVGGDYSDQAPLDLGTLHGYKDCYRLREVDLAPYQPFNIHGYTNSVGVFEGCTALHTATIDTTVVNLRPDLAPDIRNLFLGCTTLKKVDIILREDNSDVGTGHILPGPSSDINQGGTFTGCGCLEYSPIDNASAGGTVGADSLFESCYSLVKVPRSLGFSITFPGYYYERTFWKCYSLQRMQGANLYGNLDLSDTKLGGAALDEVYSILLPETVYGGGAELFGLEVESLLSKINPCIYLPYRELTGDYISPVATSLGMLQAQGNLQTSLVPNIASTNTGTLGLLVDQNPTLTGLSITAELEDLILDIPTVTVTGTIGATTDSPIIAYSKGWKVVGS